MLGGVGSTYGVDQAGSEEDFFVAKETVPMGGEMSFLEIFSGFGFA